MIIKIELSSLQHSALAHNQSDVKEFLQTLATKAANIEMENIARREIRAALADPKSPTMIMDEASILQAKFDRPGYKNAAQRRAEAERLAEERRE